MTGDPTAAWLTEHLQQWVGAWPPEPGEVRVVGSRAREVPSWDGSVRPFLGVETPDGAVLSVPEDRVEAVRALGSTVDEIGAGLGDALGRPSWRFGRGYFRWSDEPLTDGDPGVWLNRDDPRVPRWLRPFNGPVLVALEHGEVAAGVGRKIHDRRGNELAVVTEEGHRGRGWARRLVAQAARRTLDDGAIPTYLHAEDNHASARTADASGFPDRGWRVLGLFPDRAT